MAGQQKEPARMSTGPDAALDSWAGLLEELDSLAAVEHSLIIEYLLIHSVLGHDAAPPSTGQAAGTAFGMATREMRHLHQLNQVLTNARRPAQLGRSRAIDEGFPAAVAPAGSSTVIDRLLVREREIATAVDRRYERVRSAVALGGPSVDGPIAEQLTFLLDPDHVGALAFFEKELRAIAASGVSLGEHHEAADQVEKTLVDLSDRWYGLVLAIADAWFSNETELGGQLYGRAITAMQEFSGVNQLLVEHGLLPRFTPPAD
jgi:hypothetical protein